MQPVRVPAEAASAEKRRLKWFGMTRRTLIYLELVPKPGVFFDDDFAHPSAALHGA